MGLFDVLLSLFLCGILSINAVPFSTMERLYNNLTTGHNTNLRPETDLDTPTTITLDFNVINLQDINEVDGTVAMTGYFVASWTDQNIKWNPSDYGGAEYIILPQDLIWKPPLINCNSNAQFKMFGSSNAYVYVQSNGSITWSPGENLEFSCSIDISYFPFDVQMCEMEIKSWGYAPGDVNFTTLYNTVQMATYTSNSEWEVTKTGAKVDISSVRYSFTCKRRPLFLVLNLMMPVVFFAMLNICVFCLPQDSGERIGYSITIMLAVVVFLTIAQGMLPATAEPRVPAVCVMLFIDFMMSGLILISVIVSSWFYYRSEEKPVPKWIKRFVKASCCCCSDGKKNKVMDIGTNQSLDIPEKMQLKKKLSHKDEITWQDVAHTWDRLSIIFYILVLIGGMMAFFMDIMFGMNML